MATLGGAITTTSTEVESPSPTIAVVQLGALPGDIAFPHDGVEGFVEREINSTELRDAPILLVLCARVAAGPDIIAALVQQLTQGYNGCIIVPDNSPFIEHWERDLRNHKLLLIPAITRENRDQTFERLRTFVRTQKKWNTSDAVAMHPEYLFRWRPAKLMFVAHWARGDPDALAGIIGHRVSAFFFSGSVWVAFEMTCVEYEELLAQPTFTASLVSVGVDCFGVKDTNEFYSFDGKHWNAVQQPPHTIGLQIPEIVESNEWTEANEQLWDFAHEQQQLHGKAITALQRLAKMIQKSPALLSFIPSVLQDKVKWACKVKESQVAVASLPADITVLLELKLKSPKYTVRVSSSDDQCQFTVASAKKEDRTWSLSVPQLSTIYQAIDEAVAKFTTDYEIAKTSPEDIIKNPKSSPSFMCWMFKVSGACAAVVPVFCLPGLHLALRLPDSLREPGDTRVVDRLFAEFGNDVLAALPEEAKDMVAALKAVFRGTGVPGGFAEGLVSIIYDQRPVNDGELRSIFINVWRRCWLHVQQCRPVNAINRVNDLLKGVDPLTRNQLQEMARKYVQLDESSLLAALK